MSYYPVSPKGNLTVARFLLQESGTYNPVYSRPYQTHVDKHTLDSLNYRIDQNAEGYVSNELMSGLASNIVFPNATPQGEIYIPNGWTDRRIRFILEVHFTSPTGSQVIYYFQGFTSHLGVTAAGNIDPNMDFMINSLMRISRRQVMTAMGMQNQDVITEKSQVINGQLISEGSHENVYGMRPMDIFGGIHTGHLEQAINYHNPGSIVTDTRAVHNRDAFLSDKMDSLPSNYLTSVLQHYVRNQSLIEIGSGETDLYSHCRNSAFKPPPEENPFIRAIKNVRGFGTGTTFNFSDLIKIDPNTQNNTNFLSLQGTQRVSQLAVAGQSSYWNSVDRETVVATILSNSVSALMMDLMISKISFRSTNQDFSGMMNTVLIDAKSVTQADMRSSYELFRQRFEREVMYDITFGNQEIYQLEISADLFGDTMIVISLNGESPITYTTPSFCDSLLAPVFSTNKENFHHVVSDFEILFNGISQNTSSSGVLLNNNI